MAFAALQWQATNSKNQLVLGPSGQQAVISAEDFGQISVIKLPDPGTSSTSFVLTDVKGGTQTVHGNLTVTGTVTGSGGVDLDGNLVFDNGADRSILFNADKSGADGVKLSILGNSSDGGAGGALDLQGGAATSGNKAGGTVSITGGAAFGSGTAGEVLIVAGDGGDGTGTGGALTLNSGDGGATGGNSGAIDIRTGAGFVGESGLIEITSGTGQAGTTKTGNVTIATGFSALTGGTSTGDLILRTGASTDTATSGKITVTAGKTATATGANVEITAGEAATTGGKVTVDAGKGSGIATNGAIEIGAGTNPAGSITIGKTTQLGATTVLAQRMNTISVTSARTLLVGESGSLVTFTKPAAYDITLPAPTTAGLFFDVVQGGAGAANTVSVDAGVGLLLGNWINTTAGALTGATTAGTAVRRLNFLTGASVLGDGARFTSNGTNWFVRAWTGAAAGLSFT